MFVYDRGMAAMDSGVCGELVKFHCVHILL